MMTGNDRPADPGVRTTDDDGVSVQTRLEWALRRIDPDHMIYEGAQLSRATWLDGSRLAFDLRQSTGGFKYRIFDAETRMFHTVSASALPPEAETWPPGFDVGGVPGPRALLSPDGRWSLSRVGDDLRVEDLVAGGVRHLTRDGAADYSYGNGVLMAWSGQLGARLLGFEAGPSAIWAPDGQRFLTFVADARTVRRKPFVAAPASASGSVDFVAYETIQSMSGDRSFTEARFLVFDMKAGTRIEIHVPDPYRKASDPIRSGAAFWDSDGIHVYLAFGDLTENRYSIHRVDATTGLVRTIFTETGIFLGHWSHPPPQRHGDDLLLLSYVGEHRHILRLDAVTGRRLSQVSQGELFVKTIHGVREDWVYFTVGVLDSGVDPYRYQLFRAQRDGSRQEILTDGRDDCGIVPAPGLTYFLVARRRLDGPTTWEVVDAVGQPVGALATPRLRTGEPVPERVKGLGRDGRTAIWGTLFKPSDFDPRRRYPVIHWVHGTVGFVWAPTGLDDRRVPYLQALADLGFLVLTVDGMGGTGRTASFLNVAREVGHQCAGILETILLMRQLAREHPWFDTTRVGVGGYSQGGNCSCRAIFEYPDDFHVAVAQSGNHDSRFNHAGELYGYIGWPEDHPEEFRAQDNATLAHRLKGRILFTHGALDDDVPIVATYHVIDALIKNNKRYDLMIMPSERHTNKYNLYHLRSVWSYFVNHLQGKSLAVFDNDD